MKLTTDFNNNYTLKEVNDYLRTFIKTSSSNTVPCNPVLSNSSEEKKKIDKESREHQLAVLMVEKAILDGVLDKENIELNDAWTRLAASNLETVKGLIYSYHANRIEVSELMKLSGHQLYMEGKLERLQELNDSCFQLKYREFENYNSNNTYNFNKNTISKESEPESELDALMKLSADQLYFEDGKMERLKELNFTHFKLMYKEVFGLNFSN